MKTVTISLGSRDEVTSRALAAFGGEPQGARISFASADLLWQTLTRERWELLEAMTGRGALPIVEAARLVRRDARSAEADIRALVTAGLLDQSGHSVSFPYDAVHVDLMLTKAA